MGKFIGFPDPFYGDLRLKNPAKGLLAGILLLAPPLLLF
jgi:hypothetical protein